jgi:F0F1-type ATP synthase membrane subunit b/b'
MDRSWLVYTGLTIVYIIILVIYFIRRSKSHEQELTQFLNVAQQQLEQYKLQVSQKADQQVTKAMSVVKKVQQAAANFEQQAQSEYEQIIEDAKTERREILAKTKAEVEQLFKQAEQEREEYRANRQQEIEKSLVKLVVTVTEKVVQQSLSPVQHKEIIYKALEEIKQKQLRA